MLSFSTQTAQHTEEHPPTPWRVGPCNQVTGGAGMSGGGGGGTSNKGSLSCQSIPKYVAGSGQKYELRKKSSLFSYIHWWFDSKTV